MWGRHFGGKTKKEARLTMLPEPGFREEL